MPDLIFEPIAVDARLPTCLSGRVSGGDEPMPFTSEDDVISVVSGHLWRTGDTLMIQPDDTERTAVDPQTELPDGVNVRSVYHVLSSTASTLKISESAGGEAIQLGRGVGSLVRRYVVTCRMRTTFGNIIEGKGRVLVK